FLDMETGEETRPVIHVGMTFKGTASIYPDGKTPLLFCGSGDAQSGPFGENVSQRFYIYSLLDGSLLYEGGYNDTFAPRTWHAYDSSPIIDPVTDTLIYPGENGVIYTMKLNTQYDEAAGTLKVDPSDIVKFSFDIPDKYKEGGMLWGSESSAAVWNGYLFIGDNGGSVYCLDLNTMKMVWINDVGEDINASPIFETDGGNHYLYIATTLKYGYNSHNMGNAAIYKLNAMTGEIIWKKPYEVHTVKGYAGGVLSTGALGSGLLSDYIFYSVSKTPGLEEGYLVALDKYTGQEKWKKSLDMYSWSSTVFFTSENGKNYLIQGCQNGDLLLMDAKTGDTLDKLNFGSGIEATPALYGNRLVLATRSEKIIGVKIE
ncbi:MAG: PQQ-like beta-propeller repeat protein, partial [Lachnospiraceae bacterium]|nr:PQQ-like beta-propeller repeat protein [Lachnospiraceae bacterium]